MEPMYMRACPSTWAKSSNGIDRRGTKMVILKLPMCLLLVRELESFRQNCIQDLPTEEQRGMFV